MKNQITKVNTYSLTDSKRLIAEFYNSENYLIMKLDCDENYNNEFYDSVAEIVRNSNMEYYNQLLNDYNLQSKELRELINWYKENSI